MDLIPFLISCAVATPIAIVWVYILTKNKEQMKIEQIAKVAHEINKAYCEALGDNSQTSWEDAPQWQKESAVLGVMFHMDNPYAGPDASHNSWMKQKLEDGWVYGPTKDAEKKQHPCIVPFETLPTEQKAKDFLFRQVVHSLKIQNQ
jgi:hypothetical protein